MRSGNAFLVRNIGIKILQFLATTLLPKNKQNLFFKKNANSFPQDKRWYENDQFLRGNIGSVTVKQRKFGEKAKRLQNSGIKFFLNCAN